MAGSTTFTFKRATGRTRVEAALASVFGVAFLLVAYLLATRGFLVLADDSSGSELGVRVVAPLLFGFVGSLMALGAIVAARRLVQRRVLEVGPTGIWTPATGRLSWSDIVEMRHETYFAPASRRGTPMLVHRLGIVPVDPGRIHLSGAERAVSVLSRGYMATIGRLGLSWQGAADLTRFGIGAAEFEMPFDQVLARVSEYFPITGQVSPR